MLRRELGESGCEVIGTDHTGILDDSLVIHCIQRRDDGRHGERMPRIGEPTREDLSLKGVRDRLRDDHSTRGNVAGVHPLGKGDEVRCPIVLSGREPLPGEPLAGAAEARHDLVHDEQDAVLIGEIANAGQIAGRRHEHSRGTGHALQQYGRNRRLALRDDDSLEVVERTLALLRFRGGPELGTVEEWPEEVHVSTRELVGHAAPVPCGDDRRSGVAVVRAVLREDLVTAGHEPSHPHRVLVGIGTTIGEEDLAERASGLRQDALGGLAAGEVRMRGRDHRDEISLGLDRLDHLRVLVADVHVDELAREVEVAVAGIVPDGGGETTGHHERSQRTLG